MTTLNELLNGPVPLMVVHLGDDGTHNPGWLSCPDCGHEYIHMDFVRIESASGSIIDITCSGEDEQAVSNVEMPAEGGAYKGRRHIVRIGGWCENCRMDFAWSFEQYKGQTETTFDFRLNEDDDDWSHHHVPVWADK